MARYALYIFISTKNLIPTYLLKPNPKAGTGTFFHILESALLYAASFFTAGGILKLKWFQVFDPVN